MGFAFVLLKIMNFPLSLTAKWMKFDETDDKGLIAHFYRAESLT